MITPAGSGYLLTIFFKTINGPTSGPVEVVAGTYKQTAKILNFAAMSSAPATPPVYSDTQDAADLKFTIKEGEPPTLVLEVSAPTIVRLMSDSFDEDMTIPIAADKMQLVPQAGRGAN